MEDLRAAQEKDLSDCIEGEFGTDVILTDPDGETYEYSANDPELKLRAKVRYKSVSVNPETGGPLYSEDIHVSIRTTSLTRVPQDGETWGIKLPVSPQVGAPIEDFLFTPDRAIISGADMGYIKIEPVAVGQI
jgi:hypothetical protein